MAPRRTTTAARPPRPTSRSSARGERPARPGAPRPARKRGTTSGRGGSSQPRLHRGAAGRDATRSRTARTPQRNRSLDGLRGLAVIAVVLYHFGVTWLPSGHLGVVVLLVLSGYLVTSSLLRRLREGLGSILRFWAARLRRLWPPVAVMVALVTLACVAFNHVLLTKARPDILPGLAFFENISYILRNVSYFDQIGGPSPFTHLWYLGVDVQFCLLWPLVMLAFSLLPSRSVARRLTLTLALASAVAMGVLFDPEAGITRVYYGLDTRAFAPLAGAWLAYVMPLGRRPARDLRSLVERGRLGIELAALVAIVLVGCGMVLVPDTSILLYRGGMLAAALLSCVIVATLVLPGGILSAVLSLPPLAWIGSRSLGIYLWHYPLIQLLGAASNTAPWWKVALVPALSLALAELSYRFLERPHPRNTRADDAHTSSRPTASPWSSPAAIAAAVVLGLVVVADGIGLALIEPETLVPEDAIVSTGTDAGHAMDLSHGLPETVGDIPLSDAVLSAPAEEKAAGIYDPVLIGDSVPGDAEAYFRATFPDGLMDSYVGRRPDQAVTVLDEYLAQDKVGHVVILQAFSNVPVTRDQLEHMIEACGPDRSIYLVNVRIPELMEGQINQTVAEAAEAHDNVTLIDWHTLSADTIDWIYPDGEHLTPKGQPIYINMLLDAVYEALTDVGGTITRRNTAASASGDQTQAPQDEGDTTTDEAAAQEQDAQADQASVTGMVIGDAEAGATPASKLKRADVRILMLGNSFTYYNDLPAMLADLTGAEVVTHARGGAVLAEQMSADDQMGAATLAALKDGGWDYVVLQEKSSRPIRAHAQDYQASVNELAKLVRASGATPIIFATWPYNEDAQRLENMGISRDEMAGQLREAFTQAASSTGALVADVEGAFVDADPHDLLYGTDGVHPSVIGSKLAAEVIAQTIEDDLQAKSA